MKKSFNNEILILVIIIIGTIAAAVGITYLLNNPGSSKEEENQQNVPVSLEIELKKLLQEPLFHFLLIGGALFAIYAITNPERQEGAERRIVVTAGRIEQLTNIFTKTWQRPPTPEELKGLIDHYVLEEVYYRKAIAMGIDKNDTMIRRRLRRLLLNRHRRNRKRLPRNTRWPNAYFTERGYISLNASHVRFVQSTGTY